MSYHRFAQIMSNLRFDDAVTRHRMRQEALSQMPGPSTRSKRKTTQKKGKQSEESDKFAPFRKIFCSIVNQFKNLYTPGSQLSVDEELARYRGRCTFRVYMPQKKAKYGIRIWALVDNLSGYILDLQVYLGRPEDSSEVKVTGSFIQSN